MEAHVAHNHNAARRGQHREPYRPGQRPLGRRGVDRSRRRLAMTLVRIDGAVKRIDD
jgi:hypothetical protein